MAIVPENGVQYRPSSALALYTFCPRAYVVVDNKGRKFL